MTTPPWADADLSAQLKHLCAQGETQAIEFKEDFPEQASHLAKEIAAFSTSNAGQILLGVSDSGQIVGLSGADEQAKRDVFAQRVAGICKHVKPSVHPVMKWATADDLVVCILEIPKGTAPVYYVDFRPYVRRLTTSRPAEPDEVVDAVRSFLNVPRTKNIADEKASGFLSTIASTLGRVLRWSDLELDDRNLSPWSDYWTAEGRELAANLRTIASEEQADVVDATSALRKVASAIEKVVRAPRTMGGGREFDELVSAVNEAAREAHTRFVAPLKLDDETQRQLAGQIVSMHRQLEDAWELAANHPYSDSFDDATDLAARLGRALIQLSFYPSEKFAGLRADDFRRAARALAALRFESIYFDGGESQQKVIELARTAMNSLSSWLVTSLLV